MVTIDGSQGEGGGQIVRSSLALSLVTGKPITIHKIRAGRKRPGLMRQHLAAVKAATEISRGRVDGADVGSGRLTFCPGEIQSGAYHFRVGTAGSASLVLQTVLPALLTADGPSRLTLEGGTHNPWAPPFDFLKQAFIPLVNQMGPKVKVQLVRPGFYPAGGGCIGAQVEPRRILTGFDLLERGELCGQDVRAIVSALPRHIARRECDRIASRTDWPKSCFQVEEVQDAKGPGNVVSIVIRCERVTEVFTGFGRVGVKAERVADETLKEARAYLWANVPVGPFLADQWMLLLGISAHLGGGGGAYRTVALTQHSTTHIEIIKRFLDVRINIQREEPDKFVVRIGPQGNKSDVDARWITS